MLHRAPSRAQRANKRVIGASVVSVGLALSASLYPLPGDSRLLDLFPPEGSGSESRSPGGGLVQLQFTDHDMFDAIAASALPATIRELLNGGSTVVPGFDDLSVSMLNALVETYGLPNLVLALNTLARIVPLVAGGGHGWSGPPIDLGQGVLPPLVILLDFLQHELPALFVPGSPALVTMVWPAVLRSLGLLAAAAPPPPGPGATTIAGTTPSAPGHYVMPEPSQDPPPDPAPVSTPTSEQQVAVQDPVFTPTDAPEPLPEVPAAVTVLSTPDPAPELPLETREPLEQGGIDGDPVEEPSAPDPPATAEPDDTATAEPDPPQQTPQNEPQENKPDDNPPGGADENGT